MKLNTKNLPTRMFSLVALVSFLVTTANSSAQSWIARHGLTLAQYQAEFDAQIKTGYRLTCVSGYSEGGQERYAAVWEKITGPAWVSHHGMSAADYQAKFNQYAAQGYRLTRISGYGLGNAAKFAAIWEKKAGGAWLARHNLTAAQYQAEFNARKGEGYRLIQVSGYVVNKSEFFAAIWEKKAGGAWEARHNLTAAQFQSTSAQLSAAGYMLLDTSGYTKNGIAYYTGLWEKTASLPRSSRYGVSAANYQGVFNNMYYQGYRPVMVQGFASGASSCFNSIWINGNFTSKDLSTIDSAVQGYMSSQNVQGLSLAVTKDGRLVFAKGYGFARQGLEMSPNHSLRVWSISKPLTAVGIMRLVEKGNANLLDRKVFGPGGILGIVYPTPSKNSKLNNITVRQLLNMTSGLRSCNGESVFQTPGGNVAQAMSVLMNAADLIQSDTNKKYIYSNANYFFLARIIEVLSGQSYEQYIRNNVLNPCGVTSTAYMYVGSANGEPGPGEAINTPQTKPNMQLFDGFGGWVARPMDLVRFLRHVDGSVSTSADILGNATHTAMTTGSSWNMNYACGWIVNGSLQAHNGIYTGGRSYLVELPNGLSYAVIINSEPANDSFANTLKTALDKALPAVTAYPGYSLF